MRILFFLLAALATVVTPYSQSEQLPDGFFDTPYLTDLEYPLGITFDELGRMYLWEKAGVVWVYDTEGNRMPEPLIDISERVADYAEHGLNYFLLDKDYLNNGRVFLYHVIDLHWYDYFGTPEYDPNESVVTEATIGRLSSFIVTNPSGEQPVAELETENILLGKELSEGIPILMTSHGIGSVQQGDDGTILISNGDGASFLGTDIGSDSLESRITSALSRGIIRPDQDIGSYKSQYRDVLNGKILRLDPNTGAGLPSNPFYMEDDPFHPSSLIWAMGFRNPYRMVHKPESGGHDAAAGDPGFLITGDVGAASWEEINTIPSGGLNFGWPVYEGNRNNWSFNNAPDIPNRFAPNPLYGQGNCSQEFFGFKQLIRNANPARDNFVFNRCDNNQRITEADGFMFASPPLIFWNNRNYNPGDIAALPIWNETYMDRISITDERSWVEGEDFTGEASLGGVFYTADAFPEEYHGTYFHLDYSGWIQAFDFNENNELYRVRPFASGILEPCHLALNPQDGNLYYVALEERSVRKIAFGGNPPPIARVEERQFFGGANLSVNFDASPSYDPNGTALEFSWDFGDGSSGSGVSPTHEYTLVAGAATEFNVVLTVTDAEGAQDSEELLVSLNNSPPTVEITSFNDGDKYPTDRTNLLDLKANIADAESPLEELDIRWQAYLHHNTHFHPETPSDDAVSRAFISPAGCSGDGTYWYRISLTVTDPQGLVTKQEHNIYPDCEPTPVNWINLLGDYQDRKVALDFTTDFDAPIDYLEVQRSPDFFNYVPITRLAAEQDQTYRVIDERPFLTPAYYRVKARTTAGTLYFSDPVVVGPDSNDGYLLAPNPASGSVKMTVFEAQSDWLWIELFNLNGKQFFQAKLTATAGERWEDELDLTGLPGGVYLLRLKNGDRTETQRLVIMGE